MAFSTIFTVVIIVYALVYFGMIVYDLFFKRPPADLLPKIEDEVIDISDEAGSFKPTIVGKAARRYRNKNKVPSHEDDDPDESKEKDEVETNAREPKPEPKVNENQSHFEDEQPSNRKPLEEKDSEKVKAKSDESLSNEQVQVKNEPPTDSVTDTPPSKEVTGEVFDEPPSKETQSDKTLSDEHQQTSQAKVKDDFHTQKPTIPKVELTARREKKLASGLDFVNEDLPYVRIDEDDPEAKTRILGAIKVEELIREANEVAEKGKDTAFADMLAVINVYELDIAKQEAEEFIKSQEADDSSSQPPPKVML